MRQFGTVKSFDDLTGRGVITPDYDDEREGTFEKIG